MLTKIDLKSTHGQATIDDLGLAVGTKGSPRGFKMQLYHNERTKHGHYKDDPKTNYYLYMMWQRLLNKDYPIRSIYNA